MSIPIRIPYAMGYTSTMSGSVFKLVACEQCGVEYVYELKRTAIGEGKSLLFLDNQGAEDRAAFRAEESLRRKLERGIDLVPCPACGWYQQHMIPKARREHYRWMLITGFCLAIGLIPIAVFGGVLNSAPRQGTTEPLIPWSLFLAGLGTLAVVSIGSMVGKFLLTLGYDPNAQDVESRKQLGRAQGMLREEFERFMAAQHEQEAVPTPDASPGTSPEAKKHGDGRDLQIPAYDP
jgi:hypothetical protein